jgi:hypothetical protein
VHRRDVRRSANTSRLGVDKEGVPHGCCDSQGGCHDGNESTSCGRGASACVNCSTQGLVCAASAADGGGGTCASAAKVTCTPENCVGCCEGNTCRLGTGITACGVGGEACVGCPLNAACTGGSCVVDTGSCSANNCVGCCVGSTCFAGTDNSACGVNGAKCQNCSGSGVCGQTGELGGGVCTTSRSCGLGNCASGCCDQFYQCRSGDDSLACGDNGAACGVCENNGTCVGNGCTFGTCNNSNCSGCCDDFGICQTTPDLQNCGTDGVHCVACPSGYACQSGLCVSAPTCGPKNCNGCCDSSGNCSPGTLNSACGTGGVTCAGVAAATSVCCSNASKSVWPTRIKAGDPNWGDMLLAYRWQASLRESSPDRPAASTLGRATVARGRARPPPGPLSYAARTGRRERRRGREREAADGVARRDVCRVRRRRPSVSLMRQRPTRAQRTLAWR